MSNTVKHRFQSTKADGTDTSRVRPSNWNDEHVMAGGTNEQALVRDSTQTDGARWAFLPRVLTVNTTNVGNITGGEDDLMSYSLPAGTLSANGMALEVLVWGIFAANANTKTVKFYFGAAVVTLNPTTTAPNGTDWSARLTIVRTGAATQKLLAEPRQGAVLQLTDAFSGTETLSSSVTIKCTGESGASATDDVVQHGMIVKALNC